MKIVFGVCYLLKIMTAVTSHQRMPEMIDEMPQGCAKDLVFQLCGRTDRSASLKIYSIMSYKDMAPCTDLICW